jgi:hypothetical protein
MRTGAALTMMLLAVLAVMPAPADTDYRCLHECVNGGRASSACLDDCTYTPEHTFKNTNLNPLVANKPFTAPQPLQEHALVLPEPPETRHETKDYACAAKCQKSGRQYQLCEELCTEDEDEDSESD